MIEEQKKYGVAGIFEIGKLSSGREL